MRPLGVVEKILKKHLIRKKGEVEGKIGLRVDQTLTQDATGTMAYLQFEKLKVEKIKTRLSVSYIDHNTLQIGYENADDHRYLQSIARRYGLYFSPAGRGICHQVHLEKFARPGEVLLGSDSHTPTAGGIGMLAIGAGGLDVALALAGYPFYFPKPKIFKITLKKKLSPWSSAKDIILKILQLLGTKGNKEYIIEYGGEGIKTLSVPERATIANMGAELGVISSVFPSDEITYQYLKEQKRESQWQEIKADRGAKYERELEIDLSQIEPLIACPHSPGKVKAVDEVAGKKIDQVAIGSCTNGSLADLLLVAEVLRGKRIHPSVSLVIVPASAVVLMNLIQRGAVEIFLRAGARVLEPTCGFCIGAGQSPPSGGVSLRTNNRNFKGRAGTESAEVYLASPATAATSALIGRITDPRSLGPPPRLKKTIFSGWTSEETIQPPLPYRRRKKVEIYRGPNLCEVPLTSPFPNFLQAEVMLKVGDKISTDEIIPAGEKLKYRSNIPRYAQFVFASLDPTFAQRCLENKKKGIVNLIVAGAGYGQGSSREHAALCPMFLGVRLVLAKSFERIHQTNLINAGILPLLFQKEEDEQKIRKGEMIEIKGSREKIKAGKNLVIKTKKGEIEFRYELTSREREIILAGGMLNYLRLIKN